MAEALLSMVELEGQATGWDSGQFLSYMEPSFFGLKDSVVINHGDLARGARGGDITGDGKLSLD